MNFRLGRYYYTFLRYCSEIIFLMLFIVYSSFLCFWTWRFLFYYQLNLTTSLLDQGISHGSTIDLNVSLCGGKRTICRVFNHLFFTESGVTRVSPIKFEISELWDTFSRFGSYVSKEAAQYYACNIRMRINATNFKYFLHLKFLCLKFHLNDDYAYYLITRQWSWFLLCYSLSLYQHWASWKICVTAREWNLRRF